ncbi:Glycoside hydrolase 2 (Mannanase, beta-galactosidase) [Rhodotorula toruloides]
MSGGSGQGVTWDGERVWINMSGTFSKRRLEDGEYLPNDEVGDEGVKMVLDLQDADTTLAESVAKSQIWIFGGSEPVTAVEYEAQQAAQAEASTSSSKRTRRAAFNDAVGDYDPAEYGDASDDDDDDLKEEDFDMDDDALEDGDELALEGNGKKGGKRRASAPGGERKNIILDDDERAERSARSGQEGARPIPRAVADKVLMSDIVFLRAWYQVKPKQFYNPVGNLSAWQGMCSTGEVRRAEGVKTAQDVNSLYKRVVRETRCFSTLKVPRKLQAALPFASKPKMQLPQKNKTYLQKKHAVVVEPDEKEGALAPAADPGDLARQGCQTGAQRSSGRKSWPRRTRSGASARRRRSRSSSRRGDGQKERKAGGGRFANKKRKRE